LYCQNPDTQSLEGGKTYEILELVEKITRYQSYFGTEGGVTVSGGEPTLQAGSLIELFSQLKAKGISTTLDTNGYITTQAVKDLYNYTDLVLLDVKHIDDTLHQKLTGKSNHNVLEMAKFRENQGKKMWLRYVYVPGYTDQEKYLEQWAKYFQDYKTVEKVQILPFHQLGREKYHQLKMKYELEDVQIPTPESLAKCQQIFAKYLKNVCVG
jgi:pyruvate formate lyase activating enzyme